MHTETNLVSFPAEANIQPDMEPDDQGDMVALLPEDVLTDIICRVAASPRTLAVLRSVCITLRAMVDRESLLRVWDRPFNSRSVSCGRHVHTSTGPNRWIFSSPIFLSLARSNPIDAGA